MNVYQYVASNDPKGAEQIINSFGYDVVDKTYLGKSLSELVAEVQEPAFRKIMEKHPDKNVILELFGTENETKSECNCSSCKNKKNDHYMNASGSESSTIQQTANNSLNTTSTTLAHQTNVILVVASLFIATALILKNK